MKNLKLIFSLLLLSNFALGQSGNFTTEITELEENFKLIKVQHTSGSYAEYLYEGLSEDIEISLLDNPDFNITGNDRDSYDKTLWLPGEDNGIMPSDILYFLDENQIIVYGGRRISFINADFYTVIETITVSNSGSLSDMSFMPISPYRHSLSFAGEYNSPLLVCATVSGELVVMNPYTHEIIQTFTDNEDSPLLSASVKYESESQAIVWVLNYWNGSVKLIKYNYIYNEYQFASQESWNDQIFDFIFQKTGIIVAMRDNTIELDPNNLGVINTYQVIIDKFEWDLTQPLYGHIKGEKKIAYFGGAGNVIYIDDFPIDFAFGSCYDKTNDIVYFTGIDRNESIFLTVNYCPDCLTTIKANPHVGAIDPAYNLNHTQSPSYYTVACAGKYTIIGYNSDGYPQQTITTNEHHGYRMVIDLSLDEPYRIGGVVACLKDGIIKLFKSYWCEYDENLTYLPTGISCSNTCYNIAENTTYFFYLGDGNNNTFTLYNENTGMQNIGYFIDEGPAFGRVLDCIYNEAEEKVFVAFRNDDKDKNLIYKVISSSVINHTEYLAGIPEILLNYDDKLYCAANNYDGSASYIYKVDAVTLAVEELNFPGKRIVKLEKNPDIQMVYAICEGSDVVIQIDHQNFTSNTIQVYSSDPKDICYNPNNNKVYIANYESKQIDIYNTSFNLEESINLSGKPEKIEYNSYQNKIYIICDIEGVGHNNLSVISCTEQVLMEEHEIRKSDGSIFDNTNDQFYLQTNYPSGDDNYELNIKALDNFDDEFSNIIGTENYNYSDIFLNKKRLVQSKPSINPERNKIYFGNYALSSASIINAYEETFKFRTGWNWLSFPRLERYKNETFDAITLLERIIPWPPDYLKMIYKQGGIQTNIEFFNGSWNTSGLLTDIKSSQGYKLLYENNVPDFSLRLEGAKLDYDTEIDLVEGENWVGYFLDESYYPEQCLPSDLWDVLEQIKTQYWTMTKMPSDPPYWFLEGKKTPFKYGDLVILKITADYKYFKWRMAGDGEEDTELPKTSYFTFEEQADYIPFYVETDSTSDIQEIAVLADGEVKGAAVREPGDTIVEVNGYLEGVGPGTVIEFETWNGFKSSVVKKDGYVVIDHYRRSREKRNIYTGEKASYYHISLKSNEVYDMSPDISLFSCKPNPFKQNIEFSFRLNNESCLSLEIYDIGGSLVKTIIQGTYPEGYYSFIWKGDNDTGNRIKPGLYFYRASTGNGTVLADKLALIK